MELAGRYPTSSACKNTKGRTPLHLASARGYSAVVEALAQRFPGDLEARDEYGDTPLHLAALFGHMETVDLLCQQFHYDPSVKGFKNRTAQVAIAYRAKSLVCFFFHDFGGNAV